MTTTLNDKIVRANHGRSFLSKCASVLLLAVCAVCANTATALTGSHKTESYFQAGYTNPSQCAFTDLSGGSVLNIELRNSYGLQLPYNDGIGGHTYAAVAFSIGSSASWGFGYQVTQTKPDGTHYLSTINGLGGATIIVSVASGKVSFSTSGTSDSSAGSGNGISTTSVAPSSTTPTIMVSGGVYVISPGGTVTAIAPGLGVTSTVAITGTVPLPSGAATSALQSSILAALPSSLKSGGLATNGATILTSFSGGEASNAVTGTAGSLTLYSGASVSSPIFTICTNSGTVDCWVSPISGGHTWIVPAGTTVYIPSGATALYGLSSGANTTLYCIQAGY